MAIDLKQLCRQNMEEVFGKGNFDHLDTFCDESYRIHDPASGGDLDREGEKQLARMYKAAFPDLKPSVVGMWLDHDGDTVIMNWSMTGTHQKPLQGIPATNKRCTVTGCTISRFKGGKVFEEWTHWDALGLMRQLGVVPGAQAGAARGQDERRV